jgi:hypothetical protein
VKAMTGDELNAKIEEVLFGRKWYRYPRVHTNDRWFDVETWLTEEESPLDMKPGRAVGCRPPDWCAVVEWFKNSRPPIV